MRDGTLSGRQGLLSAPRALREPLPPSSSPAAQSPLWPGHFKDGGGMRGPRCSAGRVGLASSSCWEAASAPCTWQQAMAASITRQELAQISGMVRGGGWGRGGSWVCNSRPGLGWPRGRPAGAGVPHSRPARERESCGPVPAAGRTDRASRLSWSPTLGPGLPQAGDLAESPEGGRLF